MSGNLAIAAVSAVMKFLLQNPPPENSIAAVVPALKVSVLPPHKVGTDVPCLNVFFHRATVNTGWAQNALPSRNSDGERISNPYLSLDLYYLISAHAKVDFQGEILLGFAMQVFHENPVLSRAMIRTALASASLVTADTPINVRDAFAAANLADQVEQIKISPCYLNADELSNVWSPLHTNYVPTANYKVTVVLIESKRPARAAPPVRDYNLYALPFNNPRIHDVVSDAGTGQPILGGSRIVLRGSAMRGDDTLVIVGGIEVTVPPQDLTNEEIKLNLPPGLQAGITGVHVAHRYSLGTPATPHRGIDSNVAAFVIQPQIVKAGANYQIQILAAAGALPRRLQITVDPVVENNAPATVYLNEMNAPTTRLAFSFSFDADARAPGSPPVTQLTFRIPGVPTGKYLVRVRINGAESPLDYVAPNGYESPAVDLP